MSKSAASAATRGPKTGDETSPTLQPPTTVAASARELPETFGPEVSVAVAEVDMPIAAAGGTAGAGVTPVTVIERTRSPCPSSALSCQTSVATPATAGETLTSCSKDAPGAMTVPSSKGASAWNTDEVGGFDFSIRRGASPSFIN